MKKTLLVSLLMVFLWGLGEEAKGVTVKGIRKSPSEKYARVVLDLDGPVKFTRTRLSNPDRLSIDLEDCSLSEKITPSLHIKNSILKDINASRIDKKTARVVLNLGEIESYKVFALREPHRLVIDVFGRKETRPLPDKEKDVRELMGIKRVVIDPGHGGEDPGAIGPHRLLEKDVVLAIAKKVGRILKEKYNMEIIFTRDHDVFIPLEDRTAIANSQKADLFISIHANASRSRGAKGIETYFLNWTTDEESNRVAARENQISYRKMREFQKGDFLQMILQDKERDYKNDESRDLAGGIQSSLINTLRQDYDAIENLGVKWALFYVLVGADMPSVLIETSFISNRKEEKRLSNDAYREKIAGAIAGGINGYFESKKQIVKRISSDKM